MNFLLKNNSYEVKQESSKSLTVLVRSDMRNKLRDDVQKELTKLKVTYKQERRTSLSSFDVTVFDYLDKNHIIIYKPLKEGKFAGAERTSLLESAQAYYCAAAWDMTMFSDTPTPDNLRAVKNKVFATAPVNKVITDLSEDWIDVSVKVAMKLKKEFGKKSYTFHRQSDWVLGLEENFKKLNKIEKKFSNTNKWSPADIYLVSQEELRRKFNFTSIMELNSYLNEKIKSRDVIPVSLKKALGEVKLSYVNFDTKRPTFEYAGYEIGSVYTSKSVYIKFDGGTIQFRTFPNYAGEINGKYASHGKVGIGPINTSLKKYTNDFINSQRSFRAEYDKNPQKIMETMYKFLKEYGSSIDTYEKFSEKFKQANYDWIESKYLGLELINILEKNKKNATNIVSDMLAYASSQSEYSAPYIKIE